MTTWVDAAASRIASLFLFIFFVLMSRHGMVNYRQSGFHRILACSLVNFGHGRWMTLRKHWLATFKTTNSYRVEDA